jgi:hypothetical protein
VITHQTSGYHVNAGTMSGLTCGALVAIYGREPSRFPPLGSDEDMHARVGLLRVTTAELSSANAVPLAPEQTQVSGNALPSKGAAFELPEGARGRLVRPGEVDRLAVAITPYDAGLADFLDKKAEVRTARTWGLGTEAQVGVARDGAFWIGDDIYGDDTCGGREPPLAWVLDGDRHVLARALVHYARYNIALRLARRSLDLPRSLEMRLLNCNDEQELSQVDPYAPHLSELPADRKQQYQYAACSGDRICVTIRNRSRQALYVSLLNCTVSGRVELLGRGIQVAPDKSTTFWQGGSFRQPFSCVLPTGRTSGVDRLIAIGTTRAGVDLSFLKLDASFEDALRMSHRDLAPSVRESVELWTASIVTLKISTDNLSGLVG